jgi:MbtH protein
MSGSAAEDATAATPRYRVVVNHEGQYSIWPEERPLPPGWSAEGTGGDREECLRHIEIVWTDMRPLSVRDAR